MENKKKPVIRSHEAKRHHKELDNRQKANPRLKKMRIESGGSDWFMLFQHSAV